VDILYPKKAKVPKKIGRDPKYSLDYCMMMASQVADKGMTYREAAKVYGMSHGSVHHWKKVYVSGKYPKMKKAQGMSPENKLLQLEGHVRNLKQEIADLYLENLMLKKMAEYTQQSRKQDSSVITSENLDQFQKDAK